MIRYFLVPLVLVVALFAAVGPSQAVQASSPAVVPEAGVLESRAAHRRAIRRMPLMQRPDRFGHFIGNTMRRRAR